jgi:hypothetical protein
METTREAAAALAEVARRQEGVIDRVSVPGWYWWLVAVGMVPVGAAADKRSAAVIVPVTVVYALAIAAVTVWLIAGGRPGARVSQQLLGPAGAAEIVVFVWIVVGSSLGVAFGLQAAGFGHPGTAGTLLGAILVLAGGPVLRRRLRTVMLRNRA